MKRPLWSTPAAEKILSEPCVLVVSRGELCAIQASLMDSVEEFRLYEPSEYPLRELRSALARTEYVLSPLKGEGAA